MTTLRILLAALLLAATSVAQQSDYAVKKAFEEQYKTLKAATEGAASVAALDSLKGQIDALEIDFSPRTAFLDKALYPETFAEKMTTLRNLHILTYDRVYLIQTQGVRLSDLQNRISMLTGRLDTLTVERDQLFRELAQSKKSLAELRETVRRLTATLQTRDRLLFALVDSIFLPYGRDVAQASDLQREAITQKLEKAGVMQRVTDVAAENLRFLESTQMQPRDYAGLIEHYAQFRNRWQGLRSRIASVTPLPREMPSAGGTAGTKKRVDTPPPTPPVPGAAVDSLLQRWQERLMAGFWASLEKEFTDRGLTVNHFSDGPSFSSSMTAYVSTLKASGQDASVFVNDVWKARVDREYREALVRDRVLGKTEYAMLDRMVSELGQEKVDSRFIIYSVIVVALAVLLWFIFTRKPKEQPPTPAG
jgi:hypothetical protein